MGKKVLFLDSVEKGDGSYNVAYGTDDINAIVRSLTGAGVSIFPSGETFNVSDLNSITEAMVSAGVSFDGLRVSLSDGKIHIAPGIGFFENGAIITVDADGVELEYKVAENVYVYAEYDKTLNICDFHTSEEAPTEAEGVFRIMLAVIEADGTITDQRTIARSKVASMGKNVEIEISALKESNSIMESKPARVFSAGDILWQGELNLSQFNYIISNFNYYYGEFKTNLKISKVDNLEQGPITLFSKVNNTKLPKLYLKAEGGSVRLCAEGGIASYNDYYYTEDSYIRFV